MPNWTKVKLRKIQLTRAQMAGPGGFNHAVCHSFRDIGCVKTTINTWLLIPWLMLSQMPGRTLADEPGLCYTIPGITWDLDDQDRSDLVTHKGTVIYSDRFQGTANKEYTFLGNIKAFRQNDKFSGSQATYNAKTEQLQLHGNVHIDYEGMIVDGDRAAWNFKQKKGEAENIKYWVPKSRIAGDAAMAQIENTTTSRLTRASYTSCDPNRPFWRLRAKRIGLFADKNTGEASHVILDIKNIPVLYLPYINFPLSGRKSGFLAPGFNHSDRLGVAASVPYYWNIAPHRDATFILQPTQHRGPRVFAQFRYLNPNSNGQWDGEVVLLKDQINDLESDSDSAVESRRFYYSLKHSANPFTRWRFNLDYKQVSDNAYFKHYADRLSTTSIVNLPQTADAVYVGEHTRLTARWLKYQSLSVDNTKPYEKLPEMSLNINYPNAIYRVNFKTDLNLTRFTHPDNASGNRFYIVPKLTLPFDGAPGFLRFNAGLHHTRYSLTGQSQQINPVAVRTIPVYSIDSGIFLERDLDWGGKRFLQTFEPQLLYVYIPISQNQVTAQEKIQVFEDTTLAAQSFPGLLSEYRFTGPDRIGDANHVAVTLTNRIIDALGKERITFKFGQLFYFADRRVNLNQVQETNKLSDTFLDLRTQVKEWQLNSNLQWNNVLQAVSVGRIQVRYKSTNKNMINFGYFYETDSANNAIRNNADLALLWDVHTKWNFIGRYNYSLNEKRNKEILFGLEYKDCCWAVRFGSRFYRDDNNIVQSYPFFQLELKGLASIGEDFEKLLNDNIYGTFGN